MLLIVVLKQPSGKLQNRRRKPAGRSSGDGGIEWELQKGVMGEVSHIGT